MRIKTFYTKTMSEAFREIKKHLGVDAILLSTKEIPHRSGVWGRSFGFEVVAACDDAGNVDVFSGTGDYSDTEETIDTPTIGSMEMSGKLVNSGTYSPAILTQKQLNDNTVLIQEDATALIETENEEDFASKGSISSGVCHDLIERGVDDSLVKQLLSMAVDPLTHEQHRTRSALLHSVTQAALSLLPELPDQNGMPGKNVVAFIGPTGVGKTTSIAKLAAHLSLKRNKNVVLITTDGYRIGAIDQLRTYAGLIGVPFRFVGQVSDLALAIEENKHRDYILIDTTGRSPQDLGAMNPLADYLKQSSNIERHLVVSATTSSRDMRNVMDKFEICSPDHLLFTKLDETSTPGPILNEIIRTQKSFSYYSDGQRVPEDLHAVTRERIIDLVLNRNDLAFKE